MTNGYYQSASSKQIPVMVVRLRFLGIGQTFQENMNSQLYGDILEKELQKSIKKLPKNTNVQFQHDNALWHCTDLVKAKFKKLKISVTDWLSKSLDLNCVENLWSIMDKRLTSTPIYSKQELEERLQLGRKLIKTYV